jgi:hypothetical protein
MSRPASNKWARPFKPAEYFAAAFVAVACLLLLLFAPFPQTADLTAATGSHDGEDLLRLRDYVASIDAAPVLPVSYDHNTSNIVGHEFADPDYAAVRDFVLDLEGDRPKSGPAGSPDTIELAQADNALDALREWFQNRDAPASKAPTARPK